MKRLKKNVIFIILLIAAVLAVILRKQQLNIPVVSHPDSGLVFSTEDSVLEQTWQPYIEKITGISLSYLSEADFESDVELSVYSDDYSELLLQTSIHQTFQDGEEGALKYTFKAIKVILGERYRIQIRYVDAGQEGALQIVSGRNYGGCSIAGISCNEAAAFEITALKNSGVFWAFMVFFPFVSFSLLFMTIWKRKWEECIGLSMIVTAAILYMAGLFGQLMAGMVLVYVLSAVSMLLSVYFYHKKGMCAKELYSPALLLYGVLFLLILLNCHGARFAKVDEYSQWGMAVKDMFYYQSFAKHINTTVYIPRYPPFSTLIEYFFVFANGLFTQEMVYVGFQTMLMSASMIICATAGRKWRYLLPSLAVVIAMPAIFFTDAYNCVMVDPLLAVFAAYVLICYFSEEMSGFNLLRILGGLFALNLTKDMGMVIAGLLAGIMAADRIYQALLQRKNVIRSLLGPCACVVFVLGVYMSWQIYMSIPATEAVSQPQVSENVQNAEEDAESSAEAAVESGTGVSEEGPDGTVADISEEAPVETGEDISGEAAVESGTGVSEEGPVGTVADISEEGSVETGEDISEEVSSEEETAVAEVSFQGTVNASGITLDGILGLLRHDDGGYRYQTIKNFLVEVFEGSTYRFGQVSVSYVDMYLLLLLVTGLFGYFRFWGENLHKMISFGIFTFLAGICYGMVLLFLFLFAFPLGEALGLVGHERYLASFLGGIVSALAALIIKRAAEREERNKRHSLMVALCLTVCIVACTPISSFIIKNQDTKILDEHVYGYDGIAEILRSVSGRGESIYFVCNGSAWDSYWVFRNSVSPLLNSHTGYNLYASEEAYLKQQDNLQRSGKEDWEEELNDSVIMPCERWEEELRNYQYVFIFHPNEVFGESYESLFEEADTIEDGTLYQVRCTDEGVALEYIGKTDVKSYK